jgi:hypothetical protein
MTGKSLCLTMIAAMILLTGRLAFAEIAIEDLVIRKNAEMERVLNAGNHNKLDAIRFLHRHISDDARFALTVNNPAMRGHNPAATVEMDKEAYINTFVQGTNYIDNYSVSIKTLLTEPAPGGAEALADEILTERGTMMNPNNLSAPGQQFVSRTRCRTRHALENGALVTRGGACHTDVVFEEII